jgi:hypothetical protein
LARECRRRGERGVWGQRRGEEGRVGEGGLGEAPPPPLAGRRPPTATARKGER